MPALESLGTSYASIYEVDLAQMPLVERLPDSLPSKWHLYRQYRLEQSS